MFPPYEQVWVTPRNQRAGTEPHASELGRQLADMTHRGEAVAIDTTVVAAGQKSGFEVRSTSKARHGP